MRVLIFLTNLSEKYLSLRRNYEDMIKMFIGLHVKYPLLSSRNIFEKATSIKFNENPSSGLPSCSMRTDGQTERDEVNCRFSQFCERA